MVGKINQLNFGKGIKVIVVFFVFFISSFLVNAIDVSVDKDVFTYSISSFSIPVTIKNEHFGLQNNLTDVNFSIIIDPLNDGLNVTSGNSYFISDLDAFPGSDRYVVQDVDFEFGVIESNKTFEINVTALGTNVNTSVVESDSIVFNITYQVDGVFDIQVESLDVSTQALEDFILSVNVSNIGNADKLKAFNVSLEYDSTLFEFINSSQGDLIVNDLGSNVSEVFYTITRLNTSDNKLINFTFNSIKDKGYNYDEDFKLIVYDNILYPKVSVTPIPLYDVNIVEIYNSSSGIINVTTNNLMVSIPVRIRNVGNELLDVLNVVAKVDESNLGSGSYEDFVVGSYYEPSYDYTFAASGLYNVTINVTGSNNISDFDFKTLNIIFSFNDTDGDGYFDLVNGGLDCDNNNASIHTGALDICGDGIDQDCNGADRRCSSGGGSSSKDNDEDEQVEAKPEPKPVVEKEVKVEEEKPIIETLITNVPLKFNLFDDQGKNEEHSIIIKQISAGFVAFEIRSEPVTIILAEKESAEVDVDKDGFKDIIVTLNKIFSNTRASISIEKYVEEEVDFDVEINDTQIIQNVTIGVNLTDDNLTIEPKDEPIFDNLISEDSVAEILILLILIVFIVLIGVGVYYRLNKGNGKRKSEKRKAVKKVSKIKNSKK